MEGYGPSHANSVNLSKIKGKQTEICIVKLICQWKLMYNRYKGQELNMYMYDLQKTEIN